MNEEKKDNKKTISKGFLTVLIIFAIIGVVTPATLVIAGIRRIATKPDTTVPQTMESDNALPEDSQIDDIIQGNSESGVEQTEGKQSGDAQEKDASLTGTEASNTGNGTESGSGVNETAEEGTPAEKSVLEGVAVPNQEATNIEEEVAIDDGKLNIVFLGDSIIDNFRDETGIVGIVGEKLDANVINLGIGGTCASIAQDENWDDAGWNSTSGAGVAKALAGLVDVESLRDCTAKTLIKKHMDDFPGTDIFVVEYGVNDFMYGRAKDDMENLSNPTTYEGGLRHIVMALQKVAPNAAIILCQPSYVEFFRDNGEYVGNTYTLNNGPGTEYEYGGKTANVANVYGTYLFTLDEEGITLYNAEECLLDGVHLSQTGRAIYADNLVNFIKNNVLNK